MADKHPPISLVITSTEASDTIVIQDLHPRRHRRVQFAKLPKPPPHPGHQHLQPAGEQPRQGDFMRTIDTRFEGGLAYEVVYAFEGKTIDDEDDLAVDKTTAAEAQEAQAPPSHNLCCWSLAVPPLKSTFRTVKRVLLCKS